MLCLLGARPSQVLTPVPCDILGLQVASDSQGCSLSRGHPGPSLRARLLPVPCPGRGRLSRAARLSLFHRPSTLDRDSSGSAEQPSSGFLDRFL